ncbi:MAG: ArnT family glycosyltransferase [Anaerolineae bacterium]
MSTTQPAAQPTHPGAQPALPLHPKVRLGAHLLLVLLAGAVVGTTSPVLWPYPGRDAGVFLYAGARILQGDLPYRDFWDHKPPAVFYINALGLLLGQGSAWGVWALQLLATLSTLWLTFRLLERLAGWRWAALGCGLYMAALATSLEYGNLTEQYVLPLQALALWALDSVARRRLRVAAGLILGLSGALAFALRPNLVGMWLSIALCLLLMRSMRATCRLVLLLALMAGLAVLGGIVMGFLAQGALAAMLDCVVRYNLAYVEGSASERLWALSRGLLLISRSGIPALGVAGWLVVLVRRCRHPNKQTEEPLSLVAAFVALPIELALAASSARGYLHYYMPMLLPLTLLGVRLLVSAGNWWWRRPVSWARVPALRHDWVLLASLLLLLAFPALRTRSILTKRRLHTWQPVAAYIERATGPHDRLLVWGAEAGLLWLSQRQAASRFVYLYPLLQRGYASNELTQELVADLHAEPPLLVIDTAGTDGRMPALPLPVERLDAASPESLPPGIEPLLAFLDANYELVPSEETDPSPWRVYRRRDTPRAP